MESSATRRKTIRLGERLIASLGDEHGGDVMCRWMAHYVAEQITAAETATGKAKSHAEDKCFKAIIRLWKHRASLPPGHRPFESFDPIFRGLERLDPEQSRGYYSAIWRGDSKPEPGSVEALADHIVAVDDAARVLMELAVVEATDKAVDENTKKMLREIVPFNHDLDIEAVRMLIGIRDRFYPETKTELQKAVKRLEERIRILDQFISSCKGLRPFFVKALKRLQTSATKSVG